MVAKDRDYQTCCQARRCKADATINLFSVGLCDMHWTEAANYEEGLLKDWCALRLNQFAAKEVKRHLGQVDNEDWSPHPDLGGLRFE